ncbi:protein phosphatase 1 regulatory subunit 3G [Megalops cyprinoides]|uniref:protein phosphatase 1 regulatory subunit 3G n=1 Tax=Megalops cyprinoides TaxID=118141 RepID=UPI001863D22C|nr:protein phosphatase 1 regulatory subunit 3G [Megalops cyprinoides]
MSLHKEGSPHQEKNVPLSDLHWLVENYMDIDSTQESDSPAPPENGNQTEDDYEDLEEQEILLKDRRRAKSLPAYPEQANLLEEISQSCRKRVKFADALGLNLASVKHFNATEDPHIPSKVFSRLQSFPPQPERELFGEIADKFKSTFAVDCLIPTFKMPVETNDFDTRVQRCHVALEKVTVTRFDVRGVIRALTSGCCKHEVGVRYTFNDWLSFMDAQALPVSGEDNATTGKHFVFTMYTPPFLDPSSSVHFAVYSKTDQGEFWDNNDGKNYTLKYHCMSTYETAAFDDT